MKFEIELEPRRWQRAALAEWTREFQGIVRVVTGGGKTVFSYLCIEEFFKEYPDGAVNILVPTIALLDQWYVDICDATSINEADIACYSGAEKPEEPNRINLIVLNTGRITAPSIVNQIDRPMFLIVDECHRAGSPENSRALEGHYEAMLGLSATPERESDDGLEERIVPALGEIVYRYDYRQASLDKVIVDFDLVNIEIDVSSTRLLESALVKHMIPMADNATELDVAKRIAILEQKAEKSAKTALRVPWAAKLAIAHKKERIVVFHERVGSLALIVKLLASYGMNAVAYHSHLSEHHRRDNLLLFRHGSVNTLVTCRALDEGANVPEANVAIVARSTKSTRQRIQRLGRVLRPAKGKERAVVYTLYAGDDERESLEDEAKDLEGVASVVWKAGRVL